MSVYTSDLAEKIYPDSVDFCPGQRRGELIDERAQSRSSLSLVVEFSDQSRKDAGIASSLCITALVDKNGIRNAAYLVLSGKELNFPEAGEKAMDQLREFVQDVTRLGEIRNAPSDDLAPSPSPYSDKSPQ